MCGSLSGPARSAWKRSTGLQYSFLQQQNVFRSASARRPAARGLRSHTVVRDLSPSMRLKKGGKNKAVAKGDLPTKTCIVCNRPFTWRKKWAKCWDDVKYCSERCRRSKSSAQQETVHSQDSGGD